MSHHQLLTQPVTEACRFKRDNNRRARLFDPSSFQHQGKANIYMLYRLLEYMPAGSLVIDPMAGTGSALVYTEYIYPVICGELEPHWAKQCEVNRQTITVRNLFSASAPALCCQWDAGRLPLAAKSIAAVITSPPYWDMLSNWHITSKNIQADGHPEFGMAYGIDGRNIGNIHIYEDYLRAMFAVYRESHRVLKPDGLLALILKDRVHKGQRITICQDAITLCTALGFELVDVIARKVTPSLHRHILQKNNPDMPEINDELALIFKRMDKPTPWRAALIQAPKIGSFPSQQLFQKAFQYTLDQSEIFILDKNGLVGSASSWLLIDLYPPADKNFKQRKAYAFDCVQDLVLNYGFGTGSTIELHCSQAYAPYLTQRLKTLGMTVTNPTEGLNMGQKLKWYTEMNR